jgi:hypothetical protein
MERIIFLSILAMDPFFFSPINKCKMNFYTNQISKLRVYRFLFEMTAKYMLRFSAAFNNV